MSRFSTSLYKRDDEKSMNEALQAKPDNFSFWVRFLNLGGLIPSFVPIVQAILLSFQLGSSLLVTSLT
jgi:hypothetical protein